VKRLLIDKKGLRELGVVYSWTHIQRLEDAGTFPKRVRLGECRVSWVYDEIVEWVQARIQQRPS
jgi:prophage regulatory protein